MSTAERVAPMRLRRVEGQGSVEVDDLVAVEAPLEIRLRYRRQGQTIDRPLAVTMRTPGEDEELAVGFLAGEGLLRDPAELLNVEVSPEEPGRGQERHSDRKGVLKFLGTISARSTTESSKLYFPDPW